MVGVGRRGLTPPHVLGVAILVSTVIIGFLPPVAGATASSTGKQASGGAITIGLTPRVPYWIFPFEPSLDIGFPNPQLLYGQLYPPLYATSAKGIDYSQSLAYPPTWSKNNQSVTIHLKPYKWSDGTPLTPANIAFWMGLLFSEKANFGGYTPGLFPDNVATVSYSDAADTVTFNLKTSVNPAWFATDELASDVTPIPLTWDLTAPGVKGQCSSENAAAQAASCPQVYRYLISQAQDLATYATNPLWQVVDGPFKLSSYQENVSLTLVKNPSFSGAPKPSISQIHETAFTSPTALFDALQSGTSLTFAGGPMVISSTELPRAGKNAKPTTNPLAPHYVLRTLPAFAISFIAENFNGPDRALFDQLYIRQALQSLVDQATIAKVADNGYAQAENGPIPLSSTYATKSAKHNPYPFSIKNARHYLTSNGWTIPASGAAYCSKPGTGPGQCGAGIATGTKLDFRLEDYAPGAGPEIAQDFQSNAAKVGITMSLSQSSPPAFIKDLQCNIGPTAHSCPWDLFVLSGGFTQPPYPIEAAFLSSTGGANFGRYQSAEMDSIIKNATYGSTSLSAYDNYAVKQVPFLSIPMGVQIVAYAPNLQGVPSSFSATSGAFFMNEWHLTKSS